MADTGQTKLARLDNKTILLADDEDTVRDLLAEILSSWSESCTVLKATDGVDAVRIFNENSQLIDLMLMDVVMPNMGGIEAYENIRNIKPHIPVLFLSGYLDGDEVDVLYTWESSEVKFLHKPLSLDHLRQYILELLPQTSKEQNEMT